MTVIYKPFNVKIIYGFFAVFFNAELNLFQCRISRIDIGGNDSSFPAVIRSAFKNNALLNVVNAGDIRLLKAVIALRGITFLRVPGIELRHCARICGIKHRSKPAMIRLLMVLVVINGTEIIICCSAQEVIVIIDINLFIRFFRCEGCIHLVPLSAVARFIVKVNVVPFVRVLEFPAVGILAVNNMAVNSVIGTEIVEQQRIALADCKPLIICVYNLLARSNGFRR